jgi:serine protease Do
MSSRKPTIFYGVLTGLVSLVVGMVIASRLDLAPRSFANTLNVPATNSAPLAGPIDATTFRTIAHDASPSVVSIITTSTRRRSEASEFFGFPNPFGGRRGAAPESIPQQGAGSGFIIDKAGFILTNNHVVEGANSIEVRLSSMSESEAGYPAKIVGRDELTDSALIQLTSLPDDVLQEARFGDSDQMAPGDWVMAIGNPFGLSNTVTVGVVSAVGREQLRAAPRRAEAMIQTDAAINRGNSGGPLLNIRGEVVGINTMIVSDQGGGNVGVGFAVPINTIRELLPQLRQGKVVRGRIGVALNPQPLSRDYASDLGLPNTNGSEVGSVEADGPAATSGMRAGDVIVEYNAQPVRNNRELVRMVTRTAPGTTVPVKVFRDRKSLTLNVKVEELDITQEASGAARATPRGNDLGMTLSELNTAGRRELGLTAGRGGAVVSEITPFSVAAQAGVQEGDAILSVQGRVVRTLEEAHAALDALPAGRTARLIVWREGQEVLLQMRKR